MLNLKSLPNHPCLILLCDSNESVLEKFYTTDNVDQICITSENTTYKLEDFESYWSLLNIKPWKSPFRDIFICDAQKITPTISNKLLKLLEESVFNRFIFLTKSTNSLLSTVRSRSFTLNFQVAHKENSLPYAKKDYLADLKNEQISNLSSLWHAVKSAENLPAYDLVFSYEKACNHPGLNKKMLHRTFLAELHQHLNFF